MKYDVGSLLAEISTLPEYSLLDKDSLSVNMQGVMGNFPLHVVCTWGEKDAVDALIEMGADINCVGENGETPLFRAVYENNSDLVHFLILRGANINLKNLDNVSPLDIAEHEDFGEVARLLKRDASSKE